MLKKELREILAKNRDTAGETWLDCLGLRQENNTLRVVFPHMYFADWFRLHRRAAFEDALHTCFKNLQQGDMPHIVYENAVPDTFVKKCLSQGPLKNRVQAAVSAPGGSVPFSGLPCPEVAADQDPFESFICNNKNAFPLAIAKELAANTAPAGYTPFLVCGRSGTGKSRLLQTMAAVMGRSIPADRLICSSAARFCAEDIACHNRPELFWLRHDALVLDDIQDLAENTAWQHKLVTFIDACPGLQKNALPPAQPDRKNNTATTDKITGRPAGKQTDRPTVRIIFACSGRPKALKSLAPRLRSRLESGLVVELMEPDLDVRLRYLQLKCKERHLNLTREQLLFLAQRCSQFPLLQGLVLKVGAYCAVKGNNLTQADMENIVRTGASEKMPGCREILAEVAGRLNLRPEDVLGTRRRPDLVLARQVAMYICRQKLGLSYPELGRAFGGRDHSTVIYAIKKIKKLMVSNKEIHQLVTEIEMKTP